MERLLFGYAGLRRYLVKIGSPWSIVLYVFRCSELAHNVKLPLQKVFGYLKFQSILMLDKDAHQEHFSYFSLSEIADMSVRFGFQPSIL